MTMKTTIWLFRLLAVFLLLLFAFLFVSLHGRLQEMQRQRPVAARSG